MLGFPEYIHSIWGGPPNRILIIKAPILDGEAVRFLNFVCQSSVTISEVLNSLILAV